MEMVLPSIRMVRISTIVHATENVDKVYNALMHACPKQLFPFSSNEIKAKGHHGNEIRIITFKLNTRHSENYLGFLWKQLSTLDRTQIFSTLSLLLDEKEVLHLRLNKQECFLGRLCTGEEDPLKIEIGFGHLPRLQDEKISHLEKLLETYESI